MDRRGFVTGSLSLFVAPLAVEAQPAGTVPRIGLLDLGSLAARASLWEAFRRGMRELGYVEGRTVIFEVRSADGYPDRLAGLAAELVRLKVNVIVAAANSGTDAARQATATIPIVMASGDQLARSLARPGGNVTGVNSFTVELSAKRLELARELVPGASRIAILGWEAGSPGGSPILRQTRAAAQTLGVNLLTVDVRSPAEFEGAFSTIAQARPAVLLVAPSARFFGESRRLAELAVRHRLPTVVSTREWAEAGGLISYGAKLPELFRRAAVYVDKILKGANPGDLPIEQPTTFELVVNLRTAKALGLTIPPSLLARADEVVQ